MLIKNQSERPVQPSIFIYDHQVAGIPNESIVLVTTPDGREKETCNIHHVKPVSSLDVTTPGNSSKVELPTDTFQPILGPAFNRTQLMMAIFPTTHTTYEQKQRDHRYTFT